jgi:UPF0271 protein
MARQIQTLAEVLAQDRLTLAHVKPHGAIYNMAARDPEVALAVAKGVQAVDRRLILYALAGSALVKAAQATGLTVVQEAFVDRAYRSDGSLVPRNEKGALLETEEDVRQQLRRLINGAVTSIVGSSVPIQADSLCLHSDTPQAVSLARMVRFEIESAGVRLASVRAT